MTDESEDPASIDSERNREPEQRRFKRRAPRSGTAADVADEGAFQRMLKRTTPRVFVTTTIVALNVLVFGVMVLSGVDPIEPTPDQLFPWGVSWGPLTTDGQPWRLLTATFLHYGVIHLALNMWVLWDAGRLTERLYGNTAFATLYLLSGLGGAAVSVAWHPEVASAGASGAVFGVYGALLAFAKLGGAEVPGKSFQRIRKSGAFFVLYNVAYGFLNTGIDNAAHLGGLATGFLVGWLFIRPLSQDADELDEVATPAIDRTRRGVMASIAVLVVCAVGLVLGTRAGTASGWEAFEAGGKAFETEDWPTAIERFTEAIEELPGEPGSYYNRGIAYQALGEFDAAKADYLVYRDAVPDDVQVAERLAELQAVEDASGDE